MERLVRAYLTNHPKRNHNGTITVLEVPMPATITLKNIPDELYDRLKEVANIHHRSINGEVIACLEQMLLPGRVSAKERIAKARQLRAGLEADKFDAQDIANAINQGRP
jgi:plasmid stability protein